MKKAIKPIVLITLSMIIVIFGISVVKNTVVKAMATNYLCEKYDADKSEFKLLDYRPSQIEFVEYEIFFQKPIWVDYAFEYEYNGCQFFVNRQNGKFYDDYQLEDIQNWCTKWLQKNIDERIIGAKISTTDIIQYYQENNKNYSYILQESNTEQILKTCLKETEESYLVIYYYDSIVNGLKNYKINNIIRDKLISVLGNYNNINVSYALNEMAIEKKKMYSFPWERIIKNSL